MVPDGENYPPVSAIATGLAGRCPRCGDGRLFSGFVRVAPHCEGCGLDYSFADAGDGPAVFVALFGGFIVLGGALGVEILYQPPVFAELAIFLPLTLVVCLGLLRPLKGALIALQYRHGAAELRRFGS